MNATPARIVEQFVEQMPPAIAIREQLAVNASEREMLTKMLEIAERRDTTRNVRPMNRRRDTA